MMNISSPVHSKKTWTIVMASVVMSIGGNYGIALGDDVEYARDVKPILSKYCVGCHGERDNESGVRLDRWSDLSKSTDHGPIVVRGDVDQSLMLSLMRATKQPQMPPNEEPQPSSKEIAVVENWIRNGAKGSDEVVPLKLRLKTRSNEVARPIEGGAITAIDLDERDGTMLLGQSDRVVMSHGSKREVLPIEIVGKVAQIRTTSDGRFTAIASGIPGVGGQVNLIQKSSLHDTALKPYRVIEGHTDTLYCAVINPNGTLLATGGYDRKIHLWNVETGSLVRTLEGHNGAIYDLDFDTTGNILATASADETVKIWRVDTGERLDTFGQCEAEQYTVRFDSARQRVLAAGADRRIRVWKLMSFDKPSVSPLLYSTFAHEAPVSQLALSRDGRFIASVGEDKQVKLWNAEDVTPLGVVGTIDDAPSGLQWSNADSKLVVTSLSGGVHSIDVREQIQASDKVRVSASNAKDMVDPSRSSVTVSSATNPNEDGIQSVDELDQVRLLSSAQLLTSIPAEVTGRLTNADMHSEQPGDWYAFDANAGDEWIIAINAAQSGSPLDSQLDLFDLHGKPVLRTRLQAVRETYLTFQGKGSISTDDFRLHRWEDMELNEYLYASGEVVKLWLYPRGPDSGFKVYPGAGTRVTYFGTTATTHALNEPAWIVRELSDGETPVPNGLPVLPIYYSNDDASHRKIGKDSEIQFQCKQTGRYVVRVQDARGQSGDAYSYKLIVRRPNPRFTIRAEQDEIALRPGVGTEFSVIAESFDEFDSEIEIGIEGLPEQLRIPASLTVQAGQLRAIGNVFMPEDAVSAIPAEFELKLVARGVVRGVATEVPFQKPLKVKVNSAPTMKAKIVAKDQSNDAAPIDTLIIHPGETISANVVIERGANQGDVSFGGDDCGRNLPHGCLIDNIGLNGLLIPAGQTQREFFITAAPWLEQQSRVFHLRVLVDGNPTTLPVRLLIEKR